MRICPPASRAPGLTILPTFNLGCGIAEMYVRFGRILVRMLYWVNIAMLLTLPLSKGQGAFV